MTIRTLLPLATLILFAAGLAHADIAPPPGYEEACQVKKVRQPGEECVSCGDAYHGDVEACRRKLEPEGYAHRCQTRGASTWDEVWCRTAASEEEPAEEPVDEPKAAGGCSMSVLGTGSVGGLALLVAGAVLGCRVRRSARCARGAS